MKKEAKTIAALAGGLQQMSCYPAPSITSTLRETLENPAHLRDIWSIDRKPGPCPRD